MELVISLSAQYLIYILAAASIATILLSPRLIRYNYIKLIILSALLAFAVARIAGYFYYDPRPFVIDNIQPLFPHTPDNGFPSGHTLVAMVISGTIFIYKRKSGLILGALGIWIGTARVLAGVHHPVDILASIAISSLTTFLAWLILKAVDKSFRSRQDVL
jgi:undecaprenyl-diphosphatase